MDLIKVVEIDNKIDLYKFDFPFFFGFSGIDLANLPYDFRDIQLSVCTKYLDGIKDWVKDQEPQYLDKIKKGIDDIQSFAKSRRETVYLEFASYSLEDYFINLPDWMYFSENCNSLIDRNTGYPICDDLLSSNLKQYINPVYRPAINTIEYLLSLIEDQLTYIINDIQVSLAPTETVLTSEILTPAEQIELKEKSHKIVLLHELGIIEYLKNKYYTLTSGNKDLSTLLSAITDMNYETIRKGITEYKVKGNKGNVFTENAIKSVNKILIEVKIPLIDQPKQDI